MPGMLMKFGCVAGSAPRPISVLTAGASMSSTNSRSSADAFDCDDAAAGVDHRPLGFPDHLRGAADLAGVAFGDRPCSRAGGCEVTGV